MTLFRGAGITHLPCHNTSRSCADLIASPGPATKSYSVVKPISIPSLPSIIRTSLSWAEDSFRTYGDGLSKEERKARGDREDRKQILYLRMRNAVSHDEWRNCASELDDLEGHNIWKETFECSEYDPHMVEARLKQLEDARISCDVGRMLFLIRTSLNRDLGGMSNASLYTHSHVGTKDLIDRYITTAVDTISALVDLSGQNRCDDAELKYILDQLLATRQAFGRSALLFSGGATFGMTHIGVLKVLWQKDLLPRIISGASAGSIICAVFCTRTDDELLTLLDTYAYGDFCVFGEEDQDENILHKTARFLKYGSFMDISNLATVIRNWLGDITFQEAYNRTRRILNICVSSAGIYELPRLLNYITAPNVLIWSAVAVSCSVPFVFKPCTLMAKDPVTEQPVPWSDFYREYIDGSVDGDLPMTRLSEMFNVNHFIVSQVNPHVVPFLLKDEGPNSQTEHESTSAPGWLNTMTHLAKDEVLHRMTVLSELGVFPNSLTKIASVMNQKYSGDITIYPEIQYSNVSRVLKNPTTEFMLQACASGERATWPKLGRVRNHVAIELALDSAVQKMRARVALSHSHVDTRRLTGVSRYSINSLDRNGGRANHRRRNSYSHEFEQTKRARRNSGRQLAMRLRRTHSALFFEQPLSIQELDLAAATRAMDEWDDSHQDYLANAGDGPPILGKSSDNTPQGSPDGRPPSSRRASWGPSVRPGQQNRPSRLRRFSGSSESSQRGISLQSAHSADQPSSSKVDGAKLMSPLRERLRMTPTTGDKYFDLPHPNSLY